MRCRGNCEKKDAGGTVRRGMQGNCEKRGTEGKEIR